MSLSIIIPCRNEEENINTSIMEQENKYIIMEKLDVHNGNLKLPNTRYQGSKKKINF